MGYQTIDEILNKYSKKPYVEATLLMSRAGIPIAGSGIKEARINSFTPLVSVTFEGASELAGSAGQEFKELNLRMSDGSTIIIRSLLDTYLLAVQVHTLDDGVKEDLEYLSDEIGRSISSFNR